MSNQSAAHDESLDDDELESSASFVRPRRAVDDEIDMTPMIDCVFLLLIFFIVNFRADQTKAVPLPAAKYGNPVVGLESAFITAAAGDGNTMRIYLGDQVDPSKLVSASSALDQEQEIIEYVKREISGGKKKVIINGDGELTAGQVNLIAKAAGQALDGQSIHLAVMGEGR